MFDAKLTHRGTAFLGHTDPIRVNLTYKMYQKVIHSPRLDDYVKWNRSTGSIDEGWVYFVSDEYISIEVLAKCKTDENVKDCPLHRKIHVLVVCQNWYWDELEYVSN